MTELQVARMDADGVAPSGTAADYTELADAFLEQLNELRANMATSAFVEDERTARLSEMDHALYLAARAMEPVLKPHIEQAAWEEFFAYVGAKFMGWWV